jgi:hypothetical protein
MALLRPLLLDNVPRCAPCTGVAHAGAAAAVMTVGHCWGLWYAASMMQAGRPAPAGARCAERLAAVRSAHDGGPRRAPARCCLLKPTPPHMHANACSIQQSAAMALGRLANYSDDLAEAVVHNDILPQLVRSCRCFSFVALVGPSRHDAPGIDASGARGRVSSP